MHNKQVHTKEMSLRHITSLKPKSIY